MPCTLAVAIGNKQNVNNLRKIVAKKVATEQNEIDEKIKMNEMKVTKGSVKTKA